MRETICEATKGMPSGSNTLLRLPWSRDCCQKAGHEGPRKPKRPIKSAHLLDLAPHEPSVMLAETNLSSSPTEATEYTNTTRKQWLSAASELAHPYLSQHRESDKGCWKIVFLVTGRAQIQSEPNLNNKRRQVLSDAKSSRDRRHKACIQMTPQEPSKPDDASVTSINARRSQVFGTSDTPLTPRQRR